MVVLRDDEEEQGFGRTMALFLVQGGDGDMDLCRMQSTMGRLSTGEHLFKRHL